MARSQVNAPKLRGWCALVVARRGCGPLLEVHRGRWHVVRVVCRSPRKTDRSHTKWLCACTRLTMDREFRERKIYFSNEKRFAAHLLQYYGGNFEVTRQFCFDGEVRLQRFAPDLQKYFYRRDGKISGTRKMENS